jgi:hypothetical protein
MMDRSLYPPDWDAISLRIRIRACWRCEWCGAVHGKPHPETGSKVVLTCAHLDHDPANCADSNLRALCQRCHLRYDRPLHTANAARTRRRRRIEAGQLELLQEELP